MRRYHHGGRRREVAEVNITAFLSLMVVLVPFLLITSVFSQIVILDLDLNPFGGKQDAISDTLPVSIIVRQDRIEVLDRPDGATTRITNDADGHDLESLSGLLKEFKASASERLDATILMEPQLSYDTLIRVMDTVRSRKVDSDSASSMVELFPRITVGDAPQR